MTDTGDNPEPKVPPRGSGQAGNKPPGQVGQRKFLAVIVALVMIVVGLSYLVVHDGLALGGSPTAGVSSASTQLTQVGSPLNVSINAHSKFSYAQVYFGDDTVLNYTYNGSTTFNVSHTYSSPGNYFIFFRLNYGGSIYSSFNQLVQVSVASRLNLQNPHSTYGIFNLINHTRPGVVTNHTLIFTPGTGLSFALGYSESPANTSYQVVSQQVSVNGSYAMKDTVGYRYNLSDGVYQIPESQSIVNLSNLGTGYYQIAIRTTTSNLTSTNVSGSFLYLGALNKSRPEYTTTYYEDLVVASNAKLYTPANKGTTLLNAEVVSGVDNNMDFALQDTVSGQEVVDQIVQYLVAFNGSSDTSFKPELAAHLPTIGNGEINGNYANYTQTTPWGQKYTTHLMPYENYTFTINSNATFSNGKPVTAWDFQYSMARTMILLSSSNAQGGYLGEFLLPGNISRSNTFYNITTNVTINNGSNSITFHFQKPEPVSVVYQLMATDGSEAESAQWYASHGAGLAWSPQGFQSYKKFGNPANYNVYIEDHLLSDGPYTLAYMVPGSQVVLIANPNFVSPGPWDPAPTIQQITIEYVSSEPSAYLLLESGAAQAAQIPSSNWNEVQSLESRGVVSVYNFNELSFNFFEFNANVNVTQAKKAYDAGINMPQTLFMNQNVRKAFAYLFNYNLYLNYQVGNKLFNTTFQLPYAGYLPVGAQYYESISNLNKSGSSVPYYNPQVAQNYWNAFINGKGPDSASAMGVSMSGGKAMFNKAQLNVPIFVPLLRPSLLAGATTWHTSLEKIGINAPVIQIPEDNIFYLTAGSNYMPVAWGGWFSSFAFPNRIASIGLPTNLTNYLSAGDINPWWFSGANGKSPTSNMTQVADMHAMLNDYAKAQANSTNSAIARKWYWKTNGLLVNSTYVVDVGQGVGHWVLSNTLNKNDIQNFELNPFEAGVDRLMYNGLAYGK